MMRIKINLLVVNFIQNYKCRLCQIIAINKKYYLFLDKMDKVFYFSYPDNFQLLLRCDSNPSAQRFL